MESTAASKPTEILVSPGDPPVQTEGEPIKYIHLVVKGTLDVYMTYGEPNRKIPVPCGSLKPRNFFGTELILAAAPRSRYTARVSDHGERVLLWRFAHDELLKFITEEPALFVVLLNAAHEERVKKFSERRDRVARAKSGTRLITVPYTIPREEPESPPDGINEDDRPTSPGHESSPNWKAQSG